MGNQVDQAGLVGQDGQKEMEGEQILVVVKMGKRGSKLPCHGGGMRNIGQFRPILLFCHKFTHFSVNFYRP